MDTTYEKYDNYVGQICQSNNLVEFKSHPSYKYMLEHVTSEEGLNYLQSIMTYTHLTQNDVMGFCELNDTIGKPTIYKYGKYLPKAVSPTSLRYVYHAHLILTHIVNTGNLNIDIIEIGGGYGGLCLAIHYFSNKYGITIKSYKICDLTNIINLQWLYLKQVCPTLSIDFVDSNTYGYNINANNLFLVSTYCFSEIAKNHQDLYIQILFPKIIHGFIAWNAIPLYDFGFNTRVEHEHPNTCKDNKYVYF